MTELLRVTDSTTRTELAKLIVKANAEAKVISRRGKSAMLRPEYARVHARINALVTDWQRAS